MVAEILIFKELLLQEKDVLFILPFVSIVQEKVFTCNVVMLCSLNYLIHNSFFYYICQLGKFCGPYFTVWPTKFEKSFVSVCPIYLRDI